MGEFQPLSTAHDRAAFDCGVTELNDFLKRTARQHQEKGVSRTLVLVDSELATTSRIVGFFSLAACESPTSGFPAHVAKGYPRQIPAVRLGRLAVDREFQGRGFGGILLGQAIRIVCHVMQSVGIAGMLVDAKDRDVADYYRQFGFVPFVNDPLQLVLPYSTFSTIPNDAR